MERLPNEAAEQVPERFITSERSRTKARLYRVLRDAARVHGLSDAVARTAERLIDFIPTDAAEPVSPVQVQRLADARGCDPRTIRNHVARLIAAGLCADRRRDGGGRAIVRDGSGRIVALFGVSFAPLLTQAPTLAAQAEEIEAHGVAKARLRGEISTLRRRLRLLLARPSAPAEMREAFAELPARVAHLDMEALIALWHRAADLEIELRDVLAEAEREAVEEAIKTEESSDRSENIGRPYITTEPDDPLSNRIPIRQPRNKPAESATQKSTPPPSFRSSGLEHVTLGMALDAAPQDWREELRAQDRMNWSGLTAVAHSRAVLLGVSPDAWMTAVAALGRSGAAILILIADANHRARGGGIRSPGGWVRRMAERAERGEAQLHRSIFGLLARGARH